jgi:hypothetical protein
MRIIFLLAVIAPWAGCGSSGGGGNASPLGNAHPGVDFGGASAPDGGYGGADGPIVGAPDAYGPSLDGSGYTYDFGYGYDSGYNYDFGYDAGSDLGYGSDFSSAGSDLGAACPGTIALTVAYRGGGATDQTVTQTEQHTVCLSGTAYYYAATPPYATLDFNLTNSSNPTSFSLKVVQGSSTSDLTFDATYQTPPYGYSYGYFNPTAPVSYSQLQLAHGGTIAGTFSGVVLTANVTNYTATLNGTFTAHLQ